MHPRLIQSPRLLQLGVVNGSAFSQDSRGWMLTADLRARLARECASKVPN